MHRGSLARRHSRHLPAHGCHLRISHRNRGGANRFWKNEQDYIDHQDEIFIYIYTSYIYIHISYIYISYYYHIICSWYSCWRIILKILGWWHQGDFQIEKPTEKPSSLRFGRTGRWRWTWWSVATSMEILGEFLRVLGGPTWIGELPSGYVKIAIENGHWHSGFSH